MNKGGIKYLLWEMLHYLKVESWTYDQLKKILADIEDQLAYLKEKGIPSHYFLEEKRQEIISRLALLENEREGAV